MLSGRVPALPMFGTVASCQDLAKLSVPAVRKASGVILVQSFNLTSTTAPRLDYARSNINTIGVCVSGATMKKWRWEYISLTLCAAYPVHRPGKGCLLPLTSTPQEPLNPGALHPHCCLGANPPRRAPQNPSRWAS